MAATYTAVMTVQADAIDKMTEKEKNGYGDASAAAEKVEKVEFQMSRMKILKNLAVVSFAFMFLFTAFQSMTNLQSSLNKEKDLGTGGLSIIYGALIISCMFIPTWLIQILGCKWTIAASMVCYILYMAAQYYATWGLIAPASIIVGLGAAPLWSAKCTYLTQTGDWYAQITKTDKDDIINRFFGVFFMLFQTSKCDDITNRFFGVFFMLFQTSQIWGNLISSEVLATEPDANLTVHYEFCGANWCPKEKNDTKQPEPNYDQIYLMLGLYLASACIAFLIVVIFLDNIQLEKHENKQGKMSPKLLIETFRHIWRSPTQKLLVPLTIYSGIEQAFIGADYTKSFITCPLGVWNVGYIMICYGVTDAICSFTFGRLVQYVGHIPFFVLAAVIHLSVQITLLFWVPDPDMMIIFYVLAALWGMGDAVWQTQINALYGYLFSKDSEAAFANYRLWESVGFIVAFAYAGALCTHIKIYVCMGVLVAGMLGYAAVEISEHRGKSHDLKHEKS